jgi:hypothetical protein
MQNAAEKDRGKRHARESQKGGLVSSTRMSGDTRRIGDGAQPDRTLRGLRRMTGSLTLSEVGGACALLGVRCARCGRHGRLRLSRLIARYGKDARLPDVRHRLSADCPHHGGTIHERCDVYFPELVSASKKRGRPD